MQRLNVLAVKRLLGRLLVVSIDYYSNYKALQYGARHFNAPLSVSIEDTKDYVKIYALNDLNTPQDIAVSYEILIL